MRSLQIVRDFESLAKEAGESLAKHKALELEIERLLRAVFCKQSILGKPPSSSKPKLYDVTPFPKSKCLPKIDETYASSKPVTSNSIPTPQESKVVKNDNVVAPGMFRINPIKPSREEKSVPNKVRASVRIKSITVSQPHVITTKDVNSDSNGFSSTGVDNTAKTRRQQPKSNTKNDRVPSASKSSCNKNKEVEVEERPRNLLVSKNKIHMSSEFNNVKLAIWNENMKFFVLCFLGTVRFENDYVAAFLGFDDLQWENILITWFISLRAWGTTYSRVYNRRTKKIIETMNMTSNELSTIDFKQSSSKLGLQGMTSGHISSGIDLTYASSTITTQQPNEGELDLLFEAMYDDHIGGQPSATPRVVLAA
nr:hypothetical protein [Tanacetum cinerariifolium]